MTADPPIPADVAAQLCADVRRELAALEPPDETGRRDLRRTLAFLDEHGDAAVHGSFTPGHVTSTALIVSPDRRRVVLTLHRRIHEWLETGGHLEAVDAALADTAVREGTEESGIRGLRLEPGLLTVRVHEHLPCRRAPGTTHYDLYHVLVAPSDAEPLISEESLDLGWFDVDALPEPLGKGVDEVVRLAVRR